MARFFIYPFTLLIVVGCVAINMSNNHVKPSTKTQQFSVSYLDSFRSIRKPKLVVGIVVDQMRQEYLYRFQDNYGNRGFRRLMNEGYQLKNMHFNYIPTATGPGHASIYSGTSPAIHGIVSNHWYNRLQDKQTYCVKDSGARLVDERVYNIENDYSRSPKNLLSSTISDELKLFTNRRSKVISISIKDRAAILPGGHMADYAFWMNRENGHFITSNFYAKKLPEWVEQFNQRDLSDSLLDLDWDTLLPISKYQHSDLDDVNLEKVYKGREQSTFPYKLSELRVNNGGYALLAGVPYGNTLITQMVKATIKNERLGNGLETDFLAISYSSTDYVGHNYGIRSKELEDTYVRLDSEIAELLSYLDKELGKDNYLLFLTADHGASDNPKYLEATKQNGQFYKVEEIKQQLNNCLSNKIGRGDYIAHIDGTQIYLRKTKKTEALTHLQDCMRGIEGLRDLFIPSQDNILDNSLIGNQIRNSYHPKRSPDAYMHFEPGWMPSQRYGTSHGSAYSSDTHVPMLWYGWHIRHGISNEKHQITQIAPTISIMLNIPFPTGSDGSVIKDLFR